MKREGNLFHQIVTMENLHRAAYRVLRGKRSIGQAGNLQLLLYGEFNSSLDVLTGALDGVGGFRCSL